MPNAPQLPTEASKPAGPHFFVIGNEKGGTGKSTTSMHLIAGFMASGARVGSMDLDSRQGTLTRYIENRRDFAAKNGLDLTMPHHHAVLESRANIKAEAEAEEATTFHRTVQELRDCDVIIIDTPGRDSYLSRLGHAQADTLITPINDSFVDLDVLAIVDPDTYRVRRPSKYAEAVFQEKMSRARRLGANRTFDWIVIRNRLSQLDSRNRQAMDQALEELSRRIGFRVAPGFSERVVFRELFLEGLTLLDLKSTGSTKMSMSHVAARQELRDLLSAIGLSDVKV
ncbi:ATPase [Hwanghaeella grinnelliae]|uniref:ATPase n=2 Tax=Hwanghaeella grinnelliae TaxID=2500179 RepID=A0A3S2WPU8_9PROT|nr:ATPase [Hwanghaeella grinnelliae]